MAQLGVKVNHFGKTDMSNLYKNQQITISLDPVLIRLTGSITLHSPLTPPTAGLPSRLKTLIGDKKSCSFDRLGYQAGLRFASISSY